jgi:uncharacterized protein YggU (UPF0235/DUF167 family)
VVAEPARCYRAEAGGVLLAVRLTPRAARDALDGVALLSDGRPVALARVRALPADGAANAALVALVAKGLRLPKSAVTIAAGHTARLKQVRIAGDPAALAREIDAWATSATPPG